jgi:hypothetical protein
MPILTITQSIHRGRIFSVVEHLVYSNIEGSYIGGLVYHMVYYYIAYIVAHDVCNIAQAYIVASARCVYI